MRLGNATAVRGLALVGGLAFLVPLVMSALAVIASPYPIRLGGHPYTGASCSSSAAGWGCVYTVTPLWLAFLGVCALVATFAVAAAFRGRAGWWMGASAGALASWPAFVLATTGGFSRQGEPWWFAWVVNAPALRSVVLLGGFAAGLALLFLVAAATPRERQSASP